MKNVLRLMAALALVASGTACANDEESGANSPANDFGTSPSAAAGAESSGTTPPPQPTGSAEPRSETTRVTLPVTGWTCSGTLGLEVSDDWSFESSDPSRETLFYLLEPGATELPAASASADCRLPRSFDPAKASEFAWGDLEGYADFVRPSLDPETTVTSTTLAGLPAVAFTTSPNGIYAHFVAAFTGGDNPALVTVFMLEFSDAKDIDELQGEFDRVLATAKGLKLKPS